MEELISLGIFLRHFFHEGKFLLDVESGNGSREIILILLWIVNLNLERYYAYMIKKNYQNLYTLCL